jgi:eukaryotic-like serine/threonine-protein kinase
MGSVYEAKHAGLGTPVAIKVLLPALARVPTVADRFRREAQVSATLKNAHVIQVTDVDQLPDGRPYLVMELLQGQSLEALLEQRKVLPREEAIDIGLQILMGLECAHGLGVVHRDLKPGNVFMDEQGVGRVAKLLDFGIAKVRASPEFQALTRPGVVMGTPQYMAPEQAFSADQADARSDLYSVGVMLYEMLSGTLPADGDSPLEVAHKVVTGKVQPLSELCPGLPQGLLNLVHSAIQSDRAARPESALAMRRGLSTFAGQLSIAGHVAATASLGDRPTPASVIRGTEKVAAFNARTSLEPGFAARPGANGTPSPPGANTGEMSRFRAPIQSPAAPSAALAGAGMPQRAAGTLAEPLASKELPPASPKILPRTAEMPRAEGRVLTPTLPTPERPPPLVGKPAKRRARALWLWLTLGSVLIGASAIAAIWVMQMLNDPGPPPPLPRLQPGITPTPLARPAPRP